MAANLTELFTSGVGAHTYRVPSLLSLGNGVLLCFAQGKLSGGGDEDASHVFSRLSTDGGTSWLKSQLVLPLAGLTDNKTMYAQQALYNKAANIVFLVFNAMPVSALCGPCITYITKSKDRGLTWSAAKPVAASNATWGSGLASGVQLLSGRLLLARRHDCDDCSGTKQAFVLISDNQGDSWHAGAMLPDGWTECDVAELRNGSVVLTARALFGPNPPFPGPRLFARSDNGGETWAHLWSNCKKEDITTCSLPDPTCEASLIGDPLGSGALYFGNPSSWHGRQNFSIHRSLDGGGTWGSLVSLYNAGSAYSDLALMDDGALAYAFERDGSRSIAFGVYKPATSVAAPQGL